MDDVNVSAPEADQEVTANAETENTEPEAVENTEGQDKSQPADVDGEGDDTDAEEKPSASKARRDRRKAEKERIHKEAEDAKTAYERERARADALEKTMQSSEMPKEADFESYEQYQAALSGFYGMQNLDKRQIAEAARAQEQSKQRLTEIDAARRQELSQNWQEQVAEAAPQYSDFKEVVMGESTPLSALMQEIVMDSDVGAHMAYQLAKNPNEARMIASLSPLEQARRMGAIEANLSRPKASKTTKAPDPMSPVGGKGGGTADPAKMSVDDYRAWRASGGKF